MNEGASGSRKEENNMKELYFRYNGKDYQFEYRTEERIEGEGRKQENFIDYYVTFKSDEHEIDIDDFLLKSVSQKTGIEHSHSNEVSIEHLDVIAEVEGSIHKYENGRNSGE